MSKERFIKKIRDNNKAVPLDLLEEQYEFTNIGITTKSKKTSYQHIPIDKIKIPEITIRDVFKKDKDFELLVASIKDNKILEPLVVYYDEGDDYYHLVIGLRRFWAAKEAGEDNIPCLIKKEKPSDSEILIYELIENLHRKNLNPFEQARGFQVLINEYGFSQARIVEMFGKPKSKVSEILKIDSISESVKERVPTSELSMEHLIEVAKQENEGNMVFLANKINTDKLNIKQTRELSKKLRGKGESKAKIVNRVMKECNRLAEDLEMFLSLEQDISQYNELSEALGNIKSKIDNLIHKYEM
jgi:ParB family chromosome partitioning protein